MSRWMIEKSGTGIEKSGTGIEKSGTGIEKSGTGIEKSGTGIEKSGTGIRRAFLSVALTAVAFTSGLHASNIDPAGSLQLVVERDSVAVSWIIDGSVFSGVSALDGSFASLLLTEVSRSAGSSTDVSGSGTGGALDVSGSGTGGALDVSGSGTGRSGSLDVSGSGTGGALDVSGSGTGGALDVSGSGTGGALDVSGSGTGGALDVSGAGTGATIDVSGSGTGSELISITLPEGTGLAMEVTLGCGTASVSVLDADFTEVVAFADVPVIGAADFCGK